MAKLKITYDLEKCIAAGLCESIDPEHFAVKDGKAKLIGGKTIKKDVFSLELESRDADQEKKVIEAAMSCPVNAISVKDILANKVIVTSDVVSKGSKEIKATYNEGKEWKLDPKGYFLIRIDKSSKLIEVGHCLSRNTVDMKITGKTATEICNTIIRENLINSMQHAAYLGKELSKAELALKHKLKYIQDSDLKLKQK